MRTTHPRRTGDTFTRRKWALGYVAGRARGYQRGSVSLPMVAGAVELAFRYGVEGARIAAVINEFGLAVAAVEDGRVFAIKPMHRGSQPGVVRASGDLNA